MKLHWLFPIGLALTTACPASESGTGGTDSSTSSTTDDPATTDATVSVTGATQGSMSNTGATMTSTMTDPVTTESPETTDDPSETADSTGTTTDDPTSTTEPETSSTGPGESSSSGEPVTPTYGPCDLEVKDPEMQCLEKGESCALIPSMNQEDPARHWCAIPCEMGDPSGCPEPTSGDATVECSGLPGAPCALSCANGETCPDGMVCFDAMINNVMRCVWET